MNYGMINQTKKDTKILMHDGQRKTMKHFTDIKIMQKWIPKANLLIIMRLQMLLYTIHNH